MKEEVQTACKFIHNTLKKTCKLTEQQLLQFTNKMQEVLLVHFRHHWHLHNPQLGSGYRCIRINHNMDPLVMKAVQECGFNICDLTLPKQLTMWIDPNEFSYRFGEDGSVHTVFLKDVKSDGLENTLWNRKKSHPCGMKKSVKVSTIKNIHPLPECVST